MAATLALQEFNHFDAATEAKKNVIQAINTVAQKLGNTPSICRKCYVHPGIIEAYLDGSLLRLLKPRTKKTLRQQANALRLEEAAVMKLLEQRLRHETS